MATYRQDTAPPGGYKDIQWSRVFRKKLNGHKLLGINLSCRVIGGFWLYYIMKGRTLAKHENADWRISLMPFYVAEGDRKRMKYYRAVRDYETNLMKDVPGWEVGKWQGLKLYNSEKRMFEEGYQTERISFDRSLSLHANLLSVKRFFFPVKEQA